MALRNKGKSRRQACLSGWVYVPCADLIAKSADSAIPARLDGRACCAALREREMRLSGGTRHGGPQFDLADHVSPHYDFHVAVHQSFE